MGRSRTLWEEGRHPGPQVVALGLAVALTGAVLDTRFSDGVGLLFDASFVAVCAATALAVRPSDFFTVGVLPPLVMLAVFVLVGAGAPGAIAHPEDGLVQAVVTGLSRHAVALVLGYALCLSCLAVRHHFHTARPTGLTARSDPGRPHLDG